MKIDVNISSKDINISFEDTNITVNITASITVNKVNTSEIEASCISENNIKREKNSICKGENCKKLIQNKNELQRK